MSTNFIKINNLNSLNDEKNNKTITFKFKSSFIENNTYNQDNNDISNTSPFLIKKIEINNHSSINNPFLNVLNNLDNTSINNIFNIIFLRLFLKTKYLIFSLIYY